MLSITQFSFTYPDKLSPFTVAVERLDFVAPVTVILGLNGSGKSTFINGLTRLYPAKFTQTPDNITIIKHSAFSTMPPVTVRDYLTQFCLLHDTPFSQVIPWLVELELKEHIHLLCSKLSSGQQARLKLVTTLLSRPDVVCFDEPSTACDLLGVDVVIHMIKRLAQQGVQVIVVSHNLLEIAQLTPDIVVFHEGRVTAHHSWQPQWANNHTLYNDCQSLLRGAPLHTLQQLSEAS